MEDKYSMTIFEYFDNNSFHDSYISQVCFDTKGVLRINLVQLLSELDTDNCKINDINTDD